MANERTETTEQQSVERVKHREDPQPSTQREEATTTRTETTTEREESSDED